LKLKTISKITLQYTQSYLKYVANDFTFSKIDFKTEYEKNTWMAKKQIYYSKLAMPRETFR
jgi:hypothetical protein